MNKDSRIEDAPPKLSARLQRASVFISHCSRPFRSGYLLLAPAAQESGIFKQLLKGIQTARCPSSRP